MLGHGTFIYQPENAISKYGSPSGIVGALKDMRMSHVWLRAHNKNGLWKKGPNQKIADACRQGGLSVGVWGWCDGNNVSRDLRNANAAIAAYSPDIYIADIEHKVGGANWSVSAARMFGSELRASNRDLPLAVSSFGYIDWHLPEIMTALDTYVDYFAPQVYWFWYPNQRMINQTTGISGVQKKKPADYARLCLHHWKKAVTKPLILTGQAYWGEATGWTQSVAEGKLGQFLSEFDSYDQIVGLNWWSFADSKAMSASMAKAITRAALDERFVSPDGNTGGHEPVSDIGVHSIEAETQDTSTGSAELQTVQWITAENLNFREIPDGSSDDNIIAALDYDASVKTAKTALPNGYVKAKALIDNEWMNGYLFKKYLRPEENISIERVIQEAISEWMRFDKGNGTEYTEPYSSYINEMWSARGYPNITGKDRDWFWSAAFISFVLENAGYTSTKFDIWHSTYINEALQNRVLERKRDFWGYRIDEAEPQVGDILCQWRQNETTYEEAETKSRFPSHTDIIIAVRDRSVVTLGGNVANSTSGSAGVSVETKTWRRAADGLMIDEQRLFSIMKNQSRPIHEQQLRV